MGKRDEEGKPMKCLLSSKLPLWTMRASWCWGNSRSQCTHVSKLSHTRDEGAGYFHQIQFWLRWLPRNPVTSELLSGKEQKCRCHGSQVRQCSLQQWRRGDQGEPWASKASHTVVTVRTGIGMQACLIPEPLPLMIWLCREQNLPVTLGMSLHLSELQDLMGIMLSAISKHCHEMTAWMCQYFDYPQGHCWLSITDHSHKVGRNHIRQTLRLSWGWLVKRS